MDEKEKQRQASEAIDHFVGRTSAALFFLRDVEVGSATPVIREDGRVILLTAAHVARDVSNEGCRLALFRNDQRFSAPFAGILLHPSADDVDVGIVVLTEDAGRLAADYAIRPHAVGGNTEAEFMDTDYTVLTGFPALLSRYLSNSLQLVNVSYRTPVQGKDERGRLLVYWDQMVPDASGEKFGWEPGKSRDTPDPYGISGGALWRFEGADRSTLWNPSKHGRLIGIASAWIEQKRIEIVEPASRWREWFEACLSAPLP
ncbi:MAG TPA: hypothetical protein PLI95_18190 [Polyangiaceae bacterium]|nr:hypothetical protein [Polyangiaceae bacterium]